MTRDDRMIDGRPWSPVPLARGSHGAVVAPHHLATAAGLHVLRAGGSAVDAAIATNAVLGVVMPNGCGIGGDAFWLIWDAAAARAARAERLRPERRGGRCRRRCATAACTTMPRRGPLTITVPGAVRSWGDAHARFGRLSRDEVLAPAIELARDGFPAWDGFIAAVEATAPARSTSELGPRGRVRGRLPAARPRRGSPASASGCRRSRDTLETLARDGFDAFYDGDLGERQARALAAAGSPIAADDLREHTLDLGRADRHRLPRRARDDPSAEQLRRRRPRAPRPARAVRAARRRRPSGRTASLTRAGSTSTSRRPSWPWPIATPT